MYKTKMYECIVFFPNENPKKWKYVRNLKKFSEFLSRSHSSWKYFNVYAKGSREYLTRFYPDNAIPKVLMVTLLLMIQLLTFSKALEHWKSGAYENTFRKATFINGLIHSATIPIRLNSQTFIVC